MVIAMNKQRKVLITITYNEMGIIVDTKAEEVAQPSAKDTNIPITDTISRQAAIDAIERNSCNTQRAIDAVNALPSAQPEPLTDKEQRISLAAMGREEKVCKQVDEECRDCREPYEDCLVRVCHEIARKVKGALWT